MALPPIGFWSYASADDTASRGRLSRLRALLADELVQRVGRRPPVHIFQDETAIPLGHDWERQIREALDAASFCVPILTPSFLQSEWCCREVQLFREGMARRGRTDLIFPLHYSDVTDFQQTRRAECADPGVLDFLRSRHWIDFRNLRLRDPGSEEVALCLARLADGIARALYQIEPVAGSAPDATKAASGSASGATKVASPTGSPRLPPPGPQDTPPPRGSRKAFPAASPGGRPRPRRALAIVASSVILVTALVLVASVTRRPGPQPAAPSKPPAPLTSPAPVNPAPAAANAAPVTASLATAATSAIRDCEAAWCPEMILVPPGSFTMGATAEAEAREGIPQVSRGRANPPHPVKIGQGFYLGRYTVTKGQYAAFIAETPPRPPGACATYETADDNSDWGTVRAGRDWQNPGFTQTDNPPVVCVSYDDAVDYAKWLSSKTLKYYFLPTEAEWEYAARAGTKTTRFWGDEPACNYANVADQSLAEQWKLTSSDASLFTCRDGAAYTARVGEYLPNNFGLYDMLGNVEQWAADCWHRNYEVGPGEENPPTNGSEWKSGANERRPNLRFAFVRRVGLAEGPIPDESSFGDTSSALCHKFRVVRGASWLDEPWMVRSAARDHAAPGTRSSVLGFRVARTP